MRNGRLFWPRLTTMGRNLGKTSQLAAVCKKLDWTLLVRNQEEAKRVKDVYGIKANSIHDNLIGTKGPYIVDTDAVSCIACAYEDIIRKKEEQIRILNKVLRKSLEVFE